MSSNHQLLHFTCSSERENINNTLNTHSIYGTDIFSIFATNISLITIRITSVDNYCTQYFRFLCYFFLYPLHSFLNYTDIINELCEKLTPSNIFWVYIALFQPWRSSLYYYLYFWLLDAYITCLWFVKFLSIKENVYEADDINVSQCMLTKITKISWQL